MMSFLKRNLGYKLLALGVAVLLYLIAIGQKNPYSRVETFLQPEINNVPTSLVMKTPPRGGTVTLAGPASMLEEARSRLVARLDARGARAGVNYLDVHYELPPGIRGVVECEGPTTQEVVFETRAERSLVVVPLYADAPPAGFQYRAPVVSPERVKVTGLSSDVAKVTRVVALLDTSESGGAIDRRLVNVLAQDAREQVVESVVVRPARVHVSLGLKKTPATKTVILSAQLSGSPAPGRHATGYRFTPATVTISGDPAALAACTGIAVPVSLGGASESVTRTVIIEPPPGVSIAGTASARVTVEIRPIDTLTGQTPASAPRPSPTPPVSSSPTPAAPPTKGNVP